MKRRSHPVVTGPCEKSFDRLATAYHRLCIICDFYFKGLLQKDGGKPNIKGQLQLWPKLSITHIKWKVPLAMMFETNFAKCQSVHFYYFEARPCCALNGPTLTILCIVHKPCSWLWPTTFLLENSIRDYCQGQKTVKFDHLRHALMDSNQLKASSSRRELSLLNTHPCKDCHLQDRQEPRPALSHLDGPISSWWQFRGRPFAAGFRFVSVPRLQGPFYLAICGLQ